MTRSFKPPVIIRNGHVQTTLTSLRLGKYLAGRRAATLKEQEEEFILECGNTARPVRLLGFFNQGSDKHKGLVTLIHGWEGSSDSSYILSAASTLHNAGFSVFRLNLRDHGNSHHLNPKPFNSSRLDEVLNGIQQINTLFPHERSHLCGFSLGGNFALRVGLKAPEHGLSLTKIIAISPLINPMTTTENMEQNHKIYHYYFIRKWKKSLRKKMTVFPEMDDKTALVRLRTLRQMHDYFVPRHTKSKTTPEYFATYKLHVNDLKQLTIPTHIINAEDDPITRASELREIARANIPMLNIHSVPYGGHCGFIQDMHLTSWADTQLVSLLST
ncbi:YheT family hydrolase [Desulforhopalus sp. 52FAK]